MNGTESSSYFACEGFDSAVWAMRGISHQKSGGHEYELDGTVPFAL